MVADLARKRMARGTKLNYSDASAHAVFEVMFLLTTPYLVDLQGFQGFLWGQGAAMGMGGVALQGPSVNFLFKDETFDVTGLLLAPGNYTLTGRVSLTADSPPGMDGGESGVAERFSLECNLTPTVVPEPCTLLLLATGAAALLYHRVRNMA